MDIMFFYVGMVQDLFMSAGVNVSYVCMHACAVDLLTSHYWCDFNEVEYSPVSSYGSFKSDIKTRYFFE